MPFFPIENDKRLGRRLILAACVFLLVVLVPVIELLPFYHNVLDRSWTWDHGKYGSSKLNLCLWQDEDHSIVESLTTKFWSRHFIWITWWSNSKEPGALVILETSRSVMPRTSYIWRTCAVAEILLMNENEYMGS